MISLNSVVRWQDMDKERCGTIPRVSIERALCQRNLLQLVSARERDLVYKCFGYRRGCGDEVPHTHTDTHTHTHTHE